MRQAIADGRLAIGSRLPPTRVLAAELRVSRGVVTEAYRRLTEDGQVEGRRRGGTVVLAAPLGRGSPRVPPVPSSSHPEPGAPGGPLTSGPGPGSGPAPGSVPGPGPGPGSGFTPALGSGSGLAPGSGPGLGPGSGLAPGAVPAPSPGLAPGSVPGPAPGPVPGLSPTHSPGPTPSPGLSPAPGPDIFDALRAAPARVDFTPGKPDLTAFPRAAWLRAERAVFDGASAEHLGYGDPRGVAPLRRAVADWLARTRGIQVGADEVLVVAGTAQALTLLHPVLRADGIDTVAVEDPGSLGTRQHLLNGGLFTPPVPVDEHGVRMDALRATGARAVLLTPAHQFPTGVVLSGERRRELLRWALDGAAGGDTSTYDSRLIIEDDYDAEHRYDRPPVPALRSLLADQVCYLGSVSKLLAPALRIGWMVAPPRHRAALTQAKRFTDLGNAALPQLVLARLMESGELERHLRLLRGRHRRRRDAMIAALAEEVPGAVVHGAAAGLHLTVTYEADVPDTELAAAALARGVKCHPLSWHRQVPGRPGLVLGYAATPPGLVAEGVAAIGAALRELSAS
ncbi:PLP-dependent aminotransferase family protein [Actinomycetota bacterium Odt1-20B]